MRLILILLALLQLSGGFGVLPGEDPPGPPPKHGGGDHPDCNHGVICPYPSVCTFIQNPPGSGTGEWFCVESAPVDPDS